MVQRDNVNGDVVFGKFGFLGSKLFFAVFFGWGAYCPLNNPTMGILIITEWGFQGFSILDRGFLGFSNSRLSSKFSSSNV